MLSKEEIIQILRDSLKTEKLISENQYSFKLYFEDVADKIANRLKAIVRQGVSQPVQTAGSLPIKFKLYDKDKNHIGNEYHEANEYGVIQIYHESLREDFHEDEKKLVREKYYIPHFYKELE
jgi:hypothetical protein